MAENSPVLVETHGRAGLIRLNRPQVLNALNAGLMRALVDALQAFDADEDIGAMVVTGSDRAFAAGADIKEMADRGPIEIMQQDHLAQWDRLAAVRKPVIAAVSGWCLGGGNELALACDLIVASETARFGQPEINLGVFPGADGTQRLARAAGKAITMEMVLNNRTLSAAEAASLGLVNYVLPVERYLQQALALANEIAARAPLAVQLAKEAVNQAFDSFLSDGIQTERRLFYFLFATEDQKEGMRAFLEKRAPQWQGK